MLERVSAELDVKPRTPANQRAEDSASGRRLQDATYALLQRSPAFSAAWGARPWQSVALLLFVAMLGGGWISTAFEPAGRAALLALMATFLGIIALRGLVLWHIAYPSPATSGVSDLPDDALPSYSILVAVYRETAVIEQLVRGLGELDYPPDSFRSCSSRKSTTPRHKRRYGMRRWRVTCIWSSCQREGRARSRAR
jgi:hypothetical protein